MSSLTGFDARAATIDILAHQQRSAGTTIACAGCGFLATSVRPEAQESQFKEHVSALLVQVTEAVRIEALETGLAWFSEAALEASRKVTPEAAPTLAGQYWRGYQAATQEIVDLLTEPALIAKALEQPVRTGETPTRVKQWLGRSSRATTPLAAS